MFFDVGSTVSLLSAEIVDERRRAAGKPVNAADELLRGQIGARVKDFFRVVLASRSRGLAVAEIDRPHEPQARAGTRAPANEKRGEEPQLSRLSRWFF
jgi:hypothetical protein